MTSSASLEAEAAAKRRALQASLTELRTRLKPSELSSGVSDAITARVTAAGEKLSEKAATPGGLVALCAMAFTSAFALGGGMPKSADDLPQAEAGLPAVSPRPAAMPRDTLMMLGQLSVAMAVGAVASRYIPATEAEKRVLAGVGPELKQKLHTHIEDQARRLVMPTTSRFGLANVLALGAATLLSRRPARNASTVPHGEA